MLYRLPAGNGAGISVDGVFHASENGLVDLPPDFAANHAEALAAHGLVVEPPVAAPAETADADAMDRRSLLAWLRHHGETTAPTSRTETLRTRVRTLQASNAL